MRAKSIDPKYKKNILPSKYKNNKINEDNFEDNESI
jgi:hypothetical protein